MKKDDITYEPRKNFKRPDLIVSHVEVGKCTLNVLNNQLKKPSKWRIYHTTDTNEFFFDFNGTRYNLNLLKNNATQTDLQKYAKKSELPTKVSQLANDKKYLTTTTVADFLKENDYITEADLANAIKDAVKSILVDPDGDGPKEQVSLQDVIESMNAAIEKLEDLDINYAQNSDIDNMSSTDETGKNNVIQVKTLSYFREKITEEIPYSIKESKPYVNINNENKEIALKEDLTWKYDL